MQTPLVTKQGAIDNMVIWTLKLCDQGESLDFTLIFLIVLRLIWTFISVSKMLLTDNIQISLWPNFSHGKIIVLIAVHIRVFCFYDVMSNCLFKQFIFFLFTSAVKGFLFLETLKKFTSITHLFITFRLTGWSLKQNDK